MKFDLKLKPTSEIKLNLGLNVDGKTQKFFTNTCAKHMDKYVPYRDGNLANYKIEGNKIIYDQPYAHYMYVGKVMGPNVPKKDKNGRIIGWFSPIKPKHYTGKKIDYSQSIARGHAFAGPNWDKRMWSAEKDKIIKEVEAFMSKMNGGK